MLRCIELARKGEGFVAPNPMVGAVIVFENQIIGEGYHKEFGKAHAEVNAIENVKDKSLLSKSTLYVSLEPCSHQGKTPPCCDLIVKHRIPKVVIGSTDTFSEVNGKGIERLKKNDINVITGVLDADCRELNKRFFTFHEKKRPYIILKWAQTKDGFIDKHREKEEKGVNWISAPETRSLVHYWRSTEMGILIGRKTAETDNPKLNVRDVFGNNPIRIILDSKLASEHTAIYDSDTLVINSLRSEKTKNLEFIKLPNLDIPTLMNLFWERNIQSILVEGGATTLQYFLNAEVWDEIRIIQGNKLYSEGLNAPKIDQKPYKVSNFGKDKVFWFKK